MMTTAIAGVAMLSAPASAAIDLDLGGYFRGYVVDVNNDTANLQDTEFHRASEIWVDGETTLDNGLTVGTHVEFDVDENGAEADAVTADEVYV